MKVAGSKEKRRIGRPPTGKVLVGFKLSPDIANRIRKVARQTGRQQSELVEEAVRHWLAGPSRTTSRRADDRSQNSDGIKYHSQKLAS
jgi:hypothetical protein